MLEPCIFHTATIVGGRVTLHLFAAAQAYYLRIEPKDKDKLSWWETGGINSDKESVCLDLFQMSWWVVLFSQCFCSGPLPYVYKMLSR